MATAPREARSVGSIAEFLMGCRFWWIVLWFALAAVPVQAAGPTVSVGAGALSLAPGQTLPATITIAEVENLYGFELELKFDPAVVQVVDADPSAPGVQLLAGDFLAPDLVVRNAADNAAGVIQYAVTQLNPSEPRSGSGALFIVTLKGTTAGRSGRIEVASALFANRDGEPIPVAVRPAEVAVGATATAQASREPTATSAPTSTPSPEPQAPSVTPSPPPALSATPSPRPSSTPRPSATARLAGPPAQEAPATATRSAAAPTLTPTPAPLPVAAAPGATSAVAEASLPAPTSTQTGPTAPAPARAVGTAPAAASLPLAQAPSPTVRVASTSGASAPARAAAQPTATATRGALARVARDEPGKPILPGNPAPNAGPGTARPPSADASIGVLAAAAAALAIALVCLAAAGVVVLRRRRS
jgi:hypothetical protein